jgi:hypothetical protein
MKSRNILSPFFAFFIIVIFGFSFAAFADEKLSGKNIFLDSDQDELSDEEEKAYGTNPDLADTDGDGYSDGVELKGGYDPLKPAPGDKIISDKDDEKEAEGMGGEQDLSADENLTQELSTDVASLISDSMADGEELNLEDIDELVQNTMDSKISFDSLPDINEDEIKIKKQNYSKLSDEEKTAKEKEDALEYLSAVSYLAIEVFPYRISDGEEVEKIFSSLVSQLALFSTAEFDGEAFVDLAENGEDFMESLKEVEVPESLLETHIQGLKLAKYAISMKGELKGDQSDPIASIVQLSKMQGILSLSMEYFNEIALQFASLGISDIPIEL